MGLKEHHSATASLMSLRINHTSQKLLQQILRWTDKSCKWNCKDVCVCVYKYLQHFMPCRNNMPDCNKLRVKLRRRQGARAYACQCSWYSAFTLAELRHIPKFRWVCGQHTADLCIWFPRCCYSEGIKKSMQFKRRCWSFSLFGFSEDHWKCWERSFVYNVA